MMIVVAGALLNDSGQVLVSQRKPSQSFPGLPETSDLPPMLAPSLCISTLRLYTLYAHYVYTLLYIQRRPSQSHGGFQLTLQEDKNSDRELTGAGKWEFPGGKVCSLHLL